MGTAANTSVNVTNQGPIIINGNVLTSGPVQDYFNSVAGSLTVTAMSSFLPSCDLTLIAAATVTIDTNLNLASLFVIGPSIVLNIPTSGFAQSITTQSDQSYSGPVTLASNTALSVTSSGSVSFSSTVDAATAGVQGLSITDMGQPDFGAGLGQSAALASLAVNTSQEFVVQVPITTVGALSLSAGVLSASGTLPSSVTNSLAVLSTLTSSTGSITLAAAQYVVEAAGFSIPNGTLNLQANQKAGTGSAVLFLSSLMKATAINVTGNGTSGNNLLTINSTIPVSQILPLLQDPNFSTDPTGLASIINSTPIVPSATVTTVDLARHTITGLTGTSGPIISYQNVQTLAELLGDNNGANLTTNHLKVSGSSGSDRAIVDNLTFQGNLMLDSSGFPTGGNFGLAAGSNAQGSQTPVAGALQSFRIAGIGNVQLAGGPVGNDLENYSNANALLIGGVGNDTLIGGHGQNVIFGGGGNDNLHAGDGAAIPLPVANPSTFFGNYLYADYSYNSGTPQLIPAPGGVSTGTLTGNLTQVGYPPQLVGNSLVLAPYNETLSNFIFASSSDLTAAQALAAGVAVAAAIDPPGQTGPFYVTGNNQLNVLGTGSGTISIFFSPSDPTQFMVDVDGVSQSFSTAQISSIQIDGGGGTETTALSLPRGSTATLTPGNATISGAGFTISVANSAAIYANGNGGGSATLDVSGQSTVSMTSLWTSVVSGSSLDFVGGFSKVTSNSSGAGNVAFLYGATSGVNALAAGPTSVSMSGPGYANQANLFPATYSVSASTADTARFTGQAGEANTYVSTSDYAYMIGAGYDNTSVFFPTATATAASTADVAYLYDDATTQDTFVASLGGATPVATLAGPQFSSQAQGFSTLLAVSRGGSDLATFNDNSSSAVDEFFAAGDLASLLSPATDPDLAYSALGFSDVTANTSSANPLHAASPGYALHTHGSWQNV
jgi:Ca2+-binding RTX toxin-like protein